MLIKALVTSPAFALGMINAWGLCHFYPFLPLTFSSPYHPCYPLKVTEFYFFWGIGCVLCHPSPYRTGPSGTYSTLCHLCSYLETFHDLENPFGWDCHDHRLWRALATTSLVLLRNAITDFPQPFPVNQVLHRLVKETIRLLIGLLDARSKTSMSYFSNWLGRICLRRISLSTASSGV